MIRNPSPGERPPGTCDGIATTPRKNPVKRPNKGPKIRTANTLATFTKLPQRHRGEQPCWTLSKTHSIAEYTIRLNRCNLEPDTRSPERWLLSPQLDRRKED
jgi:hypothetical protein